MRSSMKMVIFIPNAPINICIANDDIINELAEKYTLQICILDTYSNTQNIFMHLYTLVEGWQHFKQICRGRVAVKRFSYSNNLIL